MLRTSGSNGRDVFVGPLFVGRIPSTMRSNDTLIEDALLAPSEGRAIEFKESFDPASNREWCEVLKDVFAIANSGGGVIVFGLNSQGEPVGADLSAVRMLDPAKYSDKIEGYTGVHFDSFTVTLGRKGGHAVVCLRIDGARTPLVPRRPGTYPAANGKGQDRAFSSGVVYVRHGAKSEPATGADLERIIDRRVAAVRRELLANVRRVAAAPAGSTFDIVVPARHVQKEIHNIADANSVREHSVRATTAADAAPIRITSEPSAPAYRLVDPNETHPHRMSDLLKNVNTQLEGVGRRLSSYDIHAIDMAHGIFSRAEMAYKPKYGPRTYSDQCVKWVVDQMKGNNMFHLLARATWHRKKRGRR